MSHHLNEGDIEAYLSEIEMEVLNVHGTDKCMRLQLISIAKKIIKDLEEHLSKNKD